MDLQRRRTCGLAQHACKSTIPLQPQHCHSSRSPSMSSTGTWEHGCELLGGAAERVTRSVGGTQSQSIWASKGKTSCIASSQASPRVLLFGTFTPMLARDQGPTSVAQGPAVGGLGDAGCPWLRRCGQRPRGNSCSSKASTREVHVSGRRRYGQDHRQLLHLTGEVSGRKVVTKSA